MLAMELVSGPLHPIPDLRTSYPVVARDGLSSVDECNDLEHGGLPSELEVEPPTPKQRDYAGSSADFDAFFHRHSKAMYRLAFVILGDREGAEDVVQDVFMRVHSRWRLVSEPESYMRRAVVNGCRDTIRHRQRVSRLLVVLRRDRGDAVDDQPDLLADQISALGSRQQVVLVLRTYCQMSDSEICAITGWPLGTVKSDLRRAYGKLKEMNRE